MCVCVCVCVCVYKVDYFVETPSASQDGLSPTELLADVL